MALARAASALLAATLATALSAPAATGSGTAGEPAAGDTQKPSKPQPPEESEKRTKRMAGVWEGTYTCAQGLTGLTLTLWGEDQALQGEFSFHPVPANPGVPSGAFRMRGRSPSPGTVVLHASNADWIRRPERYVVVGLAGSTEGSTFAGRVTDGAGGPSAIGCTTFTLRRKE
jgi:eukaryotic-like serine/threonine-protein kinase